MPRIFIIQRQIHSHNLSESSYDVLYQESDCTILFKEAVCSLDEFFAFSGKISAVIVRYLQECLDGGGINEFFSINHVTILWLTSATINVLYYDCVITS